MLELRLLQLQGSRLKKVVKALKYLVDNANFDFTAAGVSLNTMDSSNRFARVDLLLRSEGFDYFRCDRSICIGINLSEMWNALKHAGNDDIITIRKADYDSETVTFTFQRPNNTADDFEMELMDIHRTEVLAMNEFIEYHAIFRMPSAGLARIWKGLSCIGGDTVMISVTGEGVKFSTKGDTGTVVVDKLDVATVIEMEDSVSLTVALRGPNSFTEASPLSRTVTISLEPDLLMVEYEIAEMGYLRYYLLRTQD